MRIIAFVGSPVEDNEKDVSPRDRLGQWAACVWDRVSALMRAGRGAGVTTSGRGKAGVQRSVLLLGAPEGQLISVCFCEVRHFPS